MSKKRLYGLIGVLLLVGVATLAFVGSRSADEAAPASADVAIKASGMLPSDGTPPIEDEEGMPGSAQDEDVVVPAATIEALIGSADAQDGRVVSLSGTILSQCTAGCQFSLDDGTGVLGVELVGRAKERVLPRGVVGRRISVQGTFQAEPRPHLLVEDPDAWTLERR